MLTLIWAILGSTIGLNGVAQDSNGVALSASLIWTGQPVANQTNGAFVAFRKQFQLTNVTNPVTLRIFADARYMLWVNGQYVQRGPSRFEPQAPEYDSLDITPLAQSGSNTIVVLVTSRISNGRVKMHAPGLTAHIVQAGQTIAATDATWKWSGQIRYRKATTDWPNIYDEVDARAESGDWTLPAYNDTAWATTQSTSNSWGALTA
ncbi:MAG: alpha-L-rhamnosidase N-terminal domain-containing protein, partial [Akkermansiaceae bacterium]|nr:alpha-L-rhamnosidase N-terminal domain-containing protein [Verrucomicrobiales bacterium]